MTRPRLPRETGTQARFGQEHGREKVPDAPDSRCLARRGQELTAGVLRTNPRFDCTFRAELRSQWPAQGEQRVRELIPSGLPLACIASKGAGAMATRNVALTETRDQQIHARVASVQHQCESEAMRAGLRMLESGEARLAGIRPAPRAEDGPGKIARWTIEMPGPRQTDTFETAIQARCRAVLQVEARGRRCAILAEGAEDRCPAGQQSIFRRVRNGVTRPLSWTFQLPAAICRATLPRCRPCSAKAAELARLSTLARSMQIRAHRCRKRRFPLAKPDQHHFRT